MEKLVRDRVPEIMKQSGVEPVFRHATPHEWTHLLCAKLKEEVAELEADPGAMELSDVVEVVRTLQRVLGIADTELEAVRATKEADRGGFTKGIVLRIA